MSNDQNSEIQPQEDSTPHKVTLQKDLFPTKLTVVERASAADLNQKLLDLMNKLYEEGYTGELFDYDDPLIDDLKEEVFSICSHLNGFGFEESYPRIIKSQTLFQQQLEHIPAHSYEFAPAVLTFVLANPERTPFTYFIDPRGGIQAVRTLTNQNLVNCSYGLSAKENEVLATPGHLVRYTETNLNQGSYVLLNVLVGFVN